MSGPLDWLQSELAGLDAAGLRRRLATVSEVDGVAITIDGRRVINFGSNDYLGLAGDPRVKTAAAEAARTRGVGAGASPLITGHTALHAELEAALASLKGAESALVFSSGYAANLGVIGALAGQGDLIAVDRLAHASVLDAARLSGARVRSFRHNDAADLDKILSSRREDVRRRWAVTDAVFSMDGDVAPVPELLAAGGRLGAGLVLDEAHATGVLGRRGTGVLEHFGLSGAGVVRIGTLSKALGGQGGFVAGSRELIEWVLNRARAYVFSTALSPAVCAGVLEAVRILRNEPERVARLASLSARLRDMLGLAAQSPPTPILPVIIGAETRTLALRDALFEAGFLVPAIRPPSVPRGTSRLRISLSALHTEAQIEALAKAIGALRPAVEA